VIQSFADKSTEQFWNGKDIGRFTTFAAAAERKLSQLDAAERLNDLRVPPGNRLEALKGDRKGKHSIRINQQFRVVFRWKATGPEGVEIVDYH
jgi:proteic killer suppression protein